MSLWEQDVEKNQRVALLIDCDNVSPGAIGGVLSELAGYGKVNVRHAHGDWNSTLLSGWRDVLLPNAIRPIQQFAYTRGKNATDAAMIIDAMDLLYSGDVDAFALMTSDSDFTPLAMRIRESGKPVYGFGEDKTPSAFVDACSRFIYTNKLQERDAQQSEPAGEVAKRSRNALRGDTALVRLLRTAVTYASDDDGWAHLGRVGHYISNNSSFSPINYGYKKLSDLISASELFEVRRRQGGTALYLRDPSV